MLRKLQFNAEPVEPVKFDIDLNVKSNTIFAFNISGEADAGTIKKIVRIVKREGKIEVKT